MLSSSRGDLDADLRSWLRPEVGDVALVGEMVGGLTCQMLHLRRADGHGDVVVRRWPGDWDGAPEGVRRETAGLQALAGSGLPLPALISADPDGSVSGRPTTVTTFLDGAVELAPPDLRRWVRRLAEMLTRIHAVPPPALEPCPQWEPGNLSWLAQDGDRGLARTARELTARPPDPSRRVLSHGDYQHFNVLWREDRVSAVVDWPTVGLADRGVDVGHCRLNLAVLFSADAAMQFLDDYEELAGVRVDPSPDLHRLLHYSSSWPEFIPRQVAGRAVADGPGMVARVRETIERTLRRV